MPCSPSTTETTALESFDGKAWKEWLRLSNWLGISGRHRVTTRTLLTAAPVRAGEASDEVALPTEWQHVF